MDFLINVLSQDTFSEDETASNIPPLEIVPGSFIYKLYQKLNLLPGELQQIKRISEKIPEDEEETVRDKSGEIIAGTFDQVIIKLTSNEDDESHFWDTIIWSFSTFTSARLLFAALVARYYTNPYSPKSNIKDTRSQEKVRKFVVKFMYRWVDLASDEIPQDVLLTMREFSESISSLSAPGSPERLLTEAIKNAKRTAPAPPRTLQEEDKEMNTTISIFLKTDIKTLAEQITLQNSNIFRSIPTGEIVSIISGMKKASDCVKFNELQNHFDLFSRFVSFSIIYNPDLDMRVKMYIMWVQLVLQFKEHNDYAAIFGAVCGLTHASVKRLSNTLDEVWRRLGAAIRAQFDTIVSLASFTDNFYNYRQQIKVTQRPCIPFIGCFQKDWIYFNETTDKEKKSSTMIYYPVLYKTVEHLMVLQQYQKDVYPFKENKDLQERLYNLRKVPDVIQLMTISSLLEKKF